MPLWAAAAARADAATRQQMGFALVDGALALGRVDPHRRRPRDFGKSEGFLDAGSALARALESYHDYKGWPGPVEIRGLPKWQTG